MTPTTKAQRKAIKRVFDRCPLNANSDRIHPGCAFTPITYRQFRATVQKGFDCLMVNWCGMWLGIEPDGHTHS